MTTIRYARYVLINEDKGIVAWYENGDRARKDREKNGGILYDTESDNQEDIEIVLYHARKKMGVE